MFIGLYKFSTEELRLATGASTPVARKKEVFNRFCIGCYKLSTEELRLATPVCPLCPVCPDGLYVFNVLEGMPTEELRLATGASAPVARKT